MVTSVARAWSPLKAAVVPRNPTHGFVELGLLLHPSMVTASVSARGDPTVMLLPATEASKSIVSAPAVASACWTAARNVHVFWAVTQAGSAVLASDASPVASTVNV